MRIWLTTALILLASAPSFAAGRNVAGVFVAPEPSPGRVILLPDPGAERSSDLERVSGRAIASKAVEELLKQQMSGLLKSTKIYHSFGFGTPIDQPNSAQTKTYLLGCRIEATADLKVQDYYVVQLGCPNQNDPKRKMFVAIGLTKMSVASIFLNGSLVPVWSERE